MKYINWIILGNLLVLASCSGGSVDRLKGDLRDVEKRQRNIRNLDAEQTSDISAIQEQLRRLSGRVDYLERAIRGTSLDTEGTAANSYPGAENQMRLPSRPELKRDTSFVPNLALLSDKRTAMQSKINGDSHFYEALLAIEEGKFTTSLRLLEQFKGSSRNPGELGGLLSFWKGISLEGINESLKALQAYASVIRDHPGHKRVSLSLYRQANIFKALGDTASTRVTLEKLVAEHPNTKEAFEAKRMLAKL